jgi:hypothetical protein
MAVKKRIVQAPDTKVLPTLELGKLNDGLSLFDPTNVIEDEDSTTVLVPQRILGFHRRKLIVEQFKEIDGVVRKNFRVVVPPNTTTAVVMLQNLTLAFGKMEIVGNLENPVFLIGGTRKPLSGFSAVAKLSDIGPVELFNGGPQLVRKANLQLQLLLSSSGAGNWSGFVDINVLYLGE